MKKILLSILALFVVAGSASAVPSPADRKRLCEQQPDKFVWVEKTQACIPVNPCLSDDIEIRKAYCANAGSFVDESVMRAVHNKYIEQILHTSPMSSSYYDMGERGGYYAYKLADGGYVSFYVQSGPDPFDYGPEWALVTAACGAYNAYDVDGPVLVDGDADEGWHCPVASSDLCEELTEFVSKLGLGDIEGHWNAADSECVLHRKGQNVIVGIATLRAFLDS